MDINAIWNELRAAIVAECQAAIEHTAGLALKQSFEAEVGAALDAMVEAVMSRKRQGVAAVILEAAFRLPREMPADQANGWPERMLDEWENFALN